MNTIVNDSGRAHATTQGASSSWNDAEPADDGLDPDFKPLTPEQAAAWPGATPPSLALALQVAAIRCVLQTLLDHEGADVRLGAGALS